MCLNPRSVRYETEDMIRLMDNRGLTIDEVRSSIAIDPELHAKLRMWIRVMPQECRKVGRVKHTGEKILPFGHHDLAFRDAVLQEFDRLIALRAEPS